MLDIPESTLELDFAGERLRAAHSRGAPWFVGLDVCRILDLKATSRALNGLDEAWCSTHSFPVTGGREGRKTIAVPGVYRLIFLSSSFKARAFCRWLEGEVLSFSLAEPCTAALPDITACNSLRDGKIRYAEQAPIKAVARLDELGADLSAVQITDLVNISRRYVA